MPMFQSLPQPSVALTLERPGDENLESYLHEYEDISKATQGDQSAYERLYRVNRQNVFLFCLRRTQNVHDAEDLTQQVFLQAYLNLSKFRGECRLGQWLYRIAMNEFLMYLRKRRNHEVPLDEVYVGGLDPASQRDQPRVVLNKIMMSQVMNTLPEYTRTLLLLRHFAGWSQRELTKWLGLPLGTTKAQLSRARKAARKAFKPRGRAGTPSSTPAARTFPALPEALAFIPGGLSTVQKPPARLSSVQS